jgi:hypothetical protein
MDGWLFLPILAGDRVGIGAGPIPHWPLQAVLDLSRDGRWSTYDVSVLKLSNVSFRGKRARMGNTLKIPSPTKLARLHFPPASQAGRLALPARCSMYMSFLSGCTSRIVLRLQYISNVKIWVKTQPPINKARQIRPS